MINNLDRIKRIEETTLSTVSMQGSFIMLSHDDYRFLLDQAQVANKGEIKHGRSNN